MEPKDQSLGKPFLLLGMYFILFFLSLFTFAGILFVPLLALPFIIYAARYSWKSAVLSGIIVLLFSYILTGVIGFYISFFYISIGIVMGLLYDQKKPAPIVVLSGMGMFILQTIIGLLISTYVFQVNIIDEFLQQLQMIEVGGGQMPQFAEVQDLIDEQIELFTYTIQNMLVAMMIFSSAAVVFLNHWLARKILRRQGVEVPGFPPFQEWRWPKSILYYYMVTIILMWVVSWSPEPSKPSFLMSVLTNLMPVLSMMLTIQGLSLVFWFSNRKKRNRLIPVLVVITMFIFWPITFLLNVVGILDLGFDFRNRVNDK